VIQPAQANEKVKALRQRRQDRGVQG